MHAISPLRLALLAIIVSVVAGCSMSHGSGEDAGPGTGGRIDGGPSSSFDGGDPGRPDAGRFVDGAAPLPYDASWAPRSDASPPRHDAMLPGDRGGDVWEGYVESHAFASGSDHIRIVFDSAAGDGPRTGTVIFGDGVPPAPVSDPNVGYPTAAAALRAFTDPYEGFEYPFSSGSVSLGGTRVQVRVRLGVLWTEWCELQVAYPMDSRGEDWLCMPNANYTAGDSCALRLDSGEEFPIDCGSLALCQPGGVCQCNSAGCTSGEVREVQIDFSVSGERGDGTIELSASRNVHVVREP